MNKAILVLMVVLLIGGGLFIFKDDIFKKTDPNNENEVKKPTINERVVTASQGKKDWQGRPENNPDFTTAEQRQNAWGDIAASIRSNLGYEPDDTPNGYDQVFGFFKGYDIDATGWHIHLFKEFILQYIQETGGLSDNLVIKGEFLRQ